MKTPQTHDELLLHLREQVAFLRASSDSYDRGFEGEARRLAATVRILVHDTKSCKSLLSQLGHKETLDYHDVSRRLPEPEEDKSGTFRMTVRFGGGLGLSPAGFMFYPQLGDPQRKLPFDRWWEAVLIERPQHEIKFSRRDVVLNVADRDGGAHVDHALDEQYAYLHRNDAFKGGTFRNGEPAEIENSPVLASVRQIAHELEGTIREQLGHLL